MISCAFVSWALSFGACHPEGPVRISPFPQLLVPAYLILFWAFSLAFLVMTGISHLSLRKVSLAFLEEYPGIWGLYAVCQLLITLSAMGIATASYLQAITPKHRASSYTILLTCASVLNHDHTHGQGKQ